MLADVKCVQGSTSHSGYSMKSEKSDMKVIPSSAPFNFDLDQMKTAVNAPRHTMPVGLSTEEFIAWAKSKSQSTRSNLAK